jgi:hypothetical protein
VGVVAPIRIDQIGEGSLSKLLDKSTLIVGSVNYEERSLNLITNILGRDTAAKLILLVLRGQQDTVGMLEEVKEKNIRRAMKVLDNLKITPIKETYRYPKEFDTTAVVENLKHEILEHVPAKILIDITGMPRKLVFFLLKAVDEVNGKSELYIMYTAAVRYPTPPSPAGVLQGLLSGKQLTKLIESRNGPKLNIVMVPSIYGIEARLLLETIRAQDENFNVKRLDVVVPLYNHDLLTGFDVLRKDSDLLRDITSYGYNLSFSFSMIDLAHRIMEITEEWQTPEQESVLGLIAPFNVKLLIVPSYYAIRNLRKRGLRNAETILPSVTQYNSLYSLGTGSTIVWRIVEDSNQSKNL